MRHGYRKNRLSEWEKVGSVGVDAGLMYIGDPCYVLGDDASHKVRSWDAFCKWLDSAGMFGTKNAAVYRDGIGVVCSTGFGDGEYNVYVKYSDEGSWGKRVAEMKIVFIGDDEDEEEDDEDDF